MKRLLLFATLINASLANAAFERIEGIAAIVDDDLITFNELEKRQKRTEREMTQRGVTPPPSSEMQSQILERMIQERLQMAQAASSGLAISEDKLTEVVKRIAAENNLTMPRFREVLSSEGLSYADFREQIRREMLLSQIKSKQVDKKVSITPREVDNYLAASELAYSNNEYLLLHILLSLPEGASAEQIALKKEEGKQLMQKLDQGEEFRQLAMKRSDGQQALNGGDLGWRKADMLPTLFADEVLGMAEGDISPLLRSSSGFHLLKLDKIRKSEQILIQQVRARHILLTPKEGVEDQTIIDQLRQLRKQILQGEKMDELAKSLSEDPGSAVKGGDLGWADPGIYVPEFQQVLAELKKGELSETFKSPFGWHIVRVEGRRDHDSSEEVLRERAFKALRERRVEEQYQQWLRQLRDQAYIDIRI